MHSSFRALTGALLAVLFAACHDPLVVENRNRPDRLRVLSTPSDLEALTSGTFRTMHNGSIGGGSLQASTRLMAGEAVVSGAVGSNYGIPRTPIPNQRGNTGPSMMDTFRSQSLAARSAADGLYMMNVGRVSLDSAARNARLKAFAWFTLGLSHGNLALVYDSAAILDPYAEPTVIPELSGYREVMTAALAYLDSALTWTTVAAAASGASGFPLPTTWMNGSPLTSAQFLQLIRTYKAHFRADVSRTLEEGAAVEWSAVLSDASSGITADFFITTQSSPNWTVSTFGAFGGGPTAQQFHQLYAGMADTSGGFEVWLRASLESKVPFLVITPDRRFPQGTTRTAQRANSPATPTGVLYFRNRSTPDYSAPDTYGTSYYEWYRLLSAASAPGGAPFPVFSHNRNDMLQAEALIRTGNIPAAAALIDYWRTRAGLPAISGVITALGQPVPGGRACVPRVPVGSGPAWSGSACGDIWEAMKWEYRMENMIIGMSSWYFPARRWNDLPEGTALHWPVPWEEMDARRHPFYQLGGVGGRDGKVGRGTYGL